MNQITIGKSTLKSSRLAYGCWRLCGSWEPHEVSPERESVGRQAVLAAYDAGYTFFDHADIYCHGHAETLFGKILSEVPGMRDEILIASKCGIRKKGDPTPDSPYRYDFSSGHILSSCEGSLGRLGVGHLDLYMLHRPDYLCHPEEVAAAFDSLQSAGKVRYFGVSNFSPSQVVALQKACPMPLVVNQMELSVMKLQHFHDGTLDQCLAESMTPMAWSPLAAGRIPSNAAIDMNLPDHAHRLQLREALDLVAHAHHVSRSVVALAWLLKHPAGILPIIGATTIAHLQDAARAESLELTREEWYKLMEAGLGHRLP